MHSCADNMLFYQTSLSFSSWNISMLSVRRGSSWTMAAWIQWLSSKFPFQVDLRILVHLPIVSWNCNSHIACENDGRLTLLAGWWLLNLRARNLISLPSRNFRTNSLATPPVAHGDFPFRSMLLFKWNSPQSRTLYETSYEILVYHVSTLNASLFHEDLLLHHWRVQNIWTHGKTLMPKYQISRCSVNRKLAVGWLVTENASK